MSAPNHEPESCAFCRSGRTDLRALVCGASGAIGRALVESLDRCPAVGLVVAASRSLGPPALEVEKSRAVRIDLTQEDFVVEAARQIGTLTDCLDLLFQCAGVLHEDTMLPEKRISQIQVEALQRSLWVHAMGPVVLQRELVALLPRRGRSWIVSFSARVGSIADNRLGGWYSYRASKATANMLQRTLALELARTRPDCIAISYHPGTVASALSEPFQRGVGAGQLKTPAQAVRDLWQVLAGLDPSASGSFLAWDGSKIPW